MGEVVNFDPNGRKLKGVYCHLYQSYSPPDQFFVVDETVYYFQDVAGYPLNEFKSLAEESHGDVPHWLRAPP